ncbi:SpaH/EbpB family LPXTG-anchored major pilin [Leuconostoc mesenteroides]|uniref:SpaH/EbpB family LPXTG-anchored major pilin n=1 Tax=Leuconostoc mesenteroides TaxID=1245 RepID=UPI0023609A4C|nr:SpaH/EbpB family LPXTG-anchored major pilin [Leuconostoc mesenteroides]
MKSKSWSQMANAILLVLPLLVSALFGITNVSADTTDSVNVTLHKRVFDEGQVPDSKTNTGEVDNNFGGTPLAGVTFTAYDVTDHYLNLRSSGDTAEKASQEVQSDAADAVPSYATKVSEGVTAGADGTVTFSNLKSKDGDKDKVYLFVETNSPTNVTQKAAPIVLALPVYKSGSDSEINSDVHVYPKNEQTDAITKDLSDESKKDLIVTLPDGSKVYNATYGQKFGYQLQIAVPWNIADKDTFNVVDTPNLGIDDDATTVKVAGLTEGTDYTVSATDATDKNGKGFKITFNPTAAAVKAAAGKS